MRGLAVALAAGLLLAACPDRQPDRPADSQPARPAGGATPVQDRLLRLPAGTPGVVAEATLAGGGVHVYLFDLPARHFADLIVEQQGADVAVTLGAPDGRRLTLVDSPNFDRGPEPVPVLAETAGRYRLEVRVLDPRARPGRYRVRVGALRPATARDRVLVEAERLFAAAEVLRSRDDRASLRGAVERGERAAGLFGEIGAPERQGEVLLRLGEAHRSLGERAAAASRFRQALALFRQAGLAAGTASALNHLGRSHAARGETQEAIACYEEALALGRELGDRRQEARNLNDLGNTYKLLGETGKALAHFAPALAAWRELGDRTSEAYTVFNIAHLYELLGEPRRALADLQRALPPLAAEGRRREVATVLARIGVVRALAGEERPGLGSLRRALRLYQEIGDRPGEARTLNDLGWVHHRLGEQRQARRLYSRSRDLYRALGHRRDEAWVLGNLGRIDEELGAPRAALAAYAEALPLLAASGSRDGEASALLGLARAHRRLGDLPAAGKAVEASISRIESLRRQVADAGLRTSFLAARQDPYAFRVDLLMELHQREPGSGHDARALAAAEEGRARGLLDLLAGYGAAAASPGDAARPLDLAAIRRDVVDPDTLLLEYALGEERSFLWVVSPGALASFELPPRRVIEEAARRAHALLVASRRTLARGQTEAALAELSHLLLAPAAPLPAGRRLLVVADGALHYVPFGALPEPGTAAPLAAAHEIVAVPSASSLGLLRRELRGRRPAPGVVAVVADPVFDAADPRVTRRVTPRVTGRAPSHRSGASRFRRLPFSREEARAVLAEAPRSGSFQALDFAASRGLVFAGGLGRYRIVHFATHGIYDMDHPELSGIVLSQVDPQGRPRDGFLHAWEVHRLDLPAELVVLSACDTALGEEIRGEGLVGLTRGFLQAGARSVLVSLWGVEDRATAELMRRFYREMLGRGRTPAAALRAAQMSIRGEPGWSAPYYWAGFVLQGDWRMETVR